MLRILSTCSFNSSHFVACLVVLLIVVIEVSLSIVLPPKRFSHEVDSILYQVKTEPILADYVLIGDSVGRQILLSYENDSRFSMLASNQAIEMTGQYFLIKRYLEKNPPPEAVIFSGLPSFLHQNLEQKFTENYVLRTFNDFSEIFELLKAKRDVIYTAKSLLYKLFPSFKYRLHLQKSILGSSSVSIYTGVAETALPIAPKTYSIGKILENYKGQGIGRYHFRKLIELLSNRGISFYYVPVPIQERGSNDPFLTNYNEVFGLLRAWQDEGFKIDFSETVPRYSRTLFRDGIHFNAEGLVQAHAYRDNCVKLLIER